ncbi:MAG: putative lipid II flippase FtsW [Christensenellales bacterium]|jgi:cell division protein FtsW
MAAKAASIKARSMRKSKMDFSIIFLTMVLVLIGLVMVYDSSYYAAQQSSLTNYDGAFYLKKQVIGMVAGIAAMLFCMFFSYEKWKKFTLPLLIAGLVLLVLVWVPGIGVEVNGAHRWIQIPPLPSIQSAEVARFALIVYFAHIMSVREKHMRKFTKGILPILAVTVLYVGLIAFQPNLSMIAAIVILTGIMLWLGGANPWHLAIIGVCGVAGIAGMMVVMPHAFQRYLAFIDPWQDPQKNGYQLVQSLYAIGGGGWTGLGFGNSRQKFLYLPYRESDFIFAIILEEFGFIGGIFLMALYWLLIWRGVVIAARCKDRFGRLLASGIVAMLAIQVVINIAVVTGSMPPTGIPLPFVSAGGSSLTIFMACIGILANISKNNRAAA